MSTEPDAHEGKGSVANARVRNPSYKRGLVEGELDPLVKTDSLSSQALKMQVRKIDLIKLYNAKRNMKKIIVLLGFILSINTNAQLVDYGSIDSNIESVYEWRIFYSDSGKIDTSLETILFYDSAGFLIEKRWEFDIHVKGDYTSEKYEESEYGTKKIITYYNPPPTYSERISEILLNRCEYFDTNSMLIRVEELIYPDIKRTKIYTYDEYGKLNQVKVFKNNKIQCKYFVMYKYF